MIKYSDGGSASPSGTSKIALLKKVLHIITSVLHVDHEVRRHEFNAMPYHRILITLFIELTTPDGSNLESIAWSIIEAFGQVCAKRIKPCGDFKALFAECIVLAATTTMPSVCLCLA